MPARPSAFWGLAAALAAAVGFDAAVSAQALERLPAARFDVMAPSARIAGAPGRMSIRHTGCRSVPPSEVRRRIVDVAIQEWAYFGFPVLDRMTAGEPEEDDAQPRPRRRRIDPVLAARVADSIAGYWSATPEGSWILSRQNRAWNGPDGIAARWEYPWSAAFISWVMCEGGLATSAQFHRAVAHHTYIDQAIRARDGATTSAAFAAFDIGERAVEPGDLVCSARRPAYRTIGERRARMGDGARTHCDVIVKVEPDAQRILAIGGNVRGMVGLKLLPAVRVNGGVAPRILSFGRRGLSAFAHLKLRAASIGSDALAGSPTVAALGCNAGARFSPPLSDALLGVRRGACVE